MLHKKVFIRIRRSNSPLNSVKHNVITQHIIWDVMGVYDCQKGQILQNSFMSEFIHVHDYIYIYDTEKRAHRERERASEREGMKQGVRVLSVKAFALRFAWSRLPHPAQTGIAFLSRHEPTRFQIRVNSVNYFIETPRPVLFPPRSWASGVAVCLYCMQQ